MPNCVALYFYFICFLSILCKYLIHFYFLWKLEVPNGTQYFHGYLNTVAVIQLCLVFQATSGGSQAAEKSKSWKLFFCLPVLDAAFESTTATVDKQTLCGMSHVFLFILHWNLILLAVVMACMQMSPVCLSKHLFSLQLWNQPQLPQLPGRRLPMSSSLLSRASKFPLVTHLCFTLFFCFLLKSKLWVVACSELQYFFCESKHLQTALLQHRWDLRKKEENVPSSVEQAGEWASPPRVCSAVCSIWVRQVIAWPFSFSLTVFLINKRKILTLWKGWTSQRD